MNAALFLFLPFFAAEPAAGTQVRALLVTHLAFSEKDRDKIAEAAVKMLASCHSSCPSSEKDFESLFRQCHLYVKLAKPREVSTRDGTKKIKVDEMIISFPTNTGGIWVRSGEDYFYFTKFEHETVLEIHELIKTGKPQ
jgi:hypothetical protein